ncbi:MAG: hypothetical protein JKX74_01865, partial [Flavobacteriales bacterium]|nr:hypothetical protein [Flavobacteriales bacterium]
MKRVIPTAIVKMLGVILIGTAVTSDNALANSDTLKSVDQPHPKNLANGMNNESLEKILQ